MKSPRKHILILCDYYLPGYKAGGPVRTLANTIDRLGDDFSFKVVTRNNDLGETESYSGVAADSWARIGKAEVCHLSPERRTFRGLKRRIRATEHDLLYLNSLFSYTFSIKPLVLRRVGLIPRRPLVLAPRGELSPGAVALKGLKKRLYLAAGKALGLYRDVIWSASSDYEVADIRHWFGKRSTIKVAPDLPARVEAVNVQGERHEKAAGSLKIVFLSRVDRKKNLDGALEILRGVNGHVQFDIYGPLEDRDYWNECQRIIEGMPPHVRVRYQGSVDHERAVAVMTQHDLFFLPTLGENFGHVILEALLAGCPVLISDQTPWRALEDKGIGWDLPLSRPEQFRAVIEACVRMGREEFARRSARARAFALAVAQDQDAVQQNRQLFQTALSGAKNRSFKMASALRNF